MQEFIDECLESRPNTSAAEIAAVIHNEKSTTISKRTVERDIAKKKPP
jgi:predicted DNA-binding transcriptional regulator YafY